MTHPIPQGFHTVTPYFLVRDGQRFIRFLEQAFDGELLARHDGTDGHILNAEVRVGDSVLMLGEPPEPHKPTQTMMYLYVPDADALYRRALAAGAKATAPMEDQFYGDRAGAVQDDEGNTWWIATRKEEVPAGELERRMKARGK